MVEDPNAAEMNIYGDEAREALMEDGEISPEEEAFMQGYEKAEQEEEESADDVYEQAFAKRSTKKRRSNVIEELDEEYEPDY